MVKVGGSLIKWPLQIQPKLIAVDLDGTIMTNSGEISSRVVNALEQARSSGVEIVFVTGRPPRWMWQLQKYFSNGKSIIANGAMIFDLATSKIQLQSLLSRDVQQEIFCRLGKFRPTSGFAIEWGNSFTREKKYLPRWDDGFDPIGVTNIESVALSNVYKILMKSSIANYSPEAFLADVYPLVSDLANVTFCNAGVPLLEFSNLLVDKGQTLSKFADGLGIKRESIIAFGDNKNDFSMLEFAGTSWIMSGGHPDGIKFATYVAPSIQEDGVAVVLEDLLNLNRKI